MTIKFLGHATFLITSEDGVRIITGPYEPEGYDGALRGPITDEADIVTVSHDHADLAGEQRILAMEPTN